MPKHLPLMILGMKKLSIKLGTIEIFQRNFIDQLLALFMVIF